GEKSTPPSARPTRPTNGASAAAPTATAKYTSPMPPKISPCGTRNDGIPAQADGAMAAYPNPPANARPTITSPPRTHPAIDFARYPTAATPTNSRTVNTRPPSFQVPYP